MIDLSTIARGCAEIITGDDGFLFLSRFTARQLEAYRQTSEYTAASLHTAGIRLSFLTDGDEIAFVCKLPPRRYVLRALVSATSSYLAGIRSGSSKYLHNRGIRRNWVGNSIINAIKMNVFELVVDGRPVSLTRAINSQFIFSLDFPERRQRRIDLYFPLLEGALIRDFTVNGTVTPIADAGKPRLLCLGDSITHGCLAEHPTNTYVNRLAEGLGMTAINQGIAGCTHLARHLDGIEDLDRPDLITIAYGTNDWFFQPSAEDIRENIHDYYCKLNQAFPGCPMVAISPIWRADMDDERPAGEFTGIRRIIEEETSDWPNMSVIDGLTVSPHDGAYYGDIYLHPNDEGFAWIAGQLIERLNVL